MAKKRPQKTFSNDRELPTPKEAKKVIDKIKEEHFNKKTDLINIYSNRAKGRDKLTTAIDKDVKQSLKEIAYKNDVKLSDVLNRILADFFEIDK